MTNGQERRSTMRDEQTHRVTFTVQEIVEYAYLVKEHLQPLIEGYVKLSFERANCYLACFYKCRHLLGIVDIGGSHSGLQNFFKKGRELSNEGYQLDWMDEEKNKAIRLCESANLPF